MKWIIKLLLIVLPIVLIVNLYRFYFLNDEFKYFGIKAFVDYMQQYNGLGNTLNYIQETQKSSLDFVNSKNFFEGLKNFFEMVGNFFMIFVGFIKDLISNIVWVLKLIGVPIA